MHTALSSKRKTIIKQLKYSALLVDDDAFNLNTLKLFLGKLNVNCDLASNGA